ncbi:MAG: glutathione S-transferase family protein [Rhodobacter sp.]|nr:glutathione S-transferase family protein [Rhodobacter sp.]
MLTVYGTLRSRTTRVVWTLEELGLPYTREKVVFAASLGDPKAADAPLNTASEAFLCVNPMGQLPALKDGDLCLAESAAICFYVARKAGGPVAPASPAEDAEMLQWAFLAASGVEPGAIEVLYTYMQGQADTEAGRARIAAGLERLARPFARIEAHLAGHDWLVGDRFTVADILMAETVRYVTVAPGALDAWPVLKAWLARCHARPAFQRMWAMRDTE